MRLPFLFTHKLAAQQFRFIRAKAFWTNFSAIFRQTLWNNKN